MRRTMAVVAALLMVGCIGWAQEEAPPPPVVEDVRAPAEEPAPTEPAAQSNQPPAPQLTFQQEIIDRAIRYYEQTQEAPPEVAAYLASNPTLGTFLYIVRYVQSVLIWLFLFLLIGMGGRKLLRPILGAKPVDAEEPSGYSRGGRSVETPGADRRAAIADTVAWVVALAIACEAVGLSWFGALWSGLMGLVSSVLSAVIWLGLLIALAALIVWSFSKHGRRLVLSLIGHFYLKHSDSRPPEGHVFTLPDGREATIVTTDTLHSLMQPVDGGAAIPMPNADIMEQYYSWASPEGEKDAA